ncbi:hypothetical protein SISNIDRAFT_483970 [Sistotremastrum niveocremeum HHB9708]|uniref:Uncharacterized protein n=1 Tax=Sistotremastrum niveocremeum HHB9708 TaxID=1314777 RepID=A0A164WIW9_9AGAM|nr:hypothetical protein SISNIDRAFT_483970 [Sistotremastrum niveocremeum HHB9708]
MANKTPRLSAPERPINLTKYPKSDGMLTGEDSNLAEMGVISEPGSLLPSAQNTVTVCGPHHKPYAPLQWSPTVYTPFQVVDQQPYLEGFCTPSVTLQRQYQIESRFGFLAPQSGRVPKTFSSPKAPSSLVDEHLETPFLLCSVEWD